MAQDCILILAFLTLLQVKHMFADFFLQTPKMLAGRGTYFHMGRTQHAAIHAVGSFLVYIVFATPLILTVLICLAEWVVHFHIDWAKGRYSELHPKTPVEAGYWYAFGTDQAAHQFTYIVMAAAFAMIHFPVA